MKLIDVDEVVKETEARVDASVPSDYPGGKPERFRMDPVLISLASVLVDEVNARLAALAGWET